MWRRRTSEHTARYAVLVHARNLLITDDEGRERIGGAYTWRYVHAGDREIASKEAIRSLLKTPAFVDEVRNLSEALDHVTVDEIREVENSDSSRGTGVVFYIDTDEQTDN